MRNKINNALFVHQIKIGVAVANERGGADEVKKFLDDPWKYNGDIFRGALNKLRRLQDDVEECLDCIDDNGSFRTVADVMKRNDGKQ